MIGNKVKNRNLFSLRQTKHRTQHFRVLSRLRESLKTVSRNLFMEHLSVTSFLDSFSVSITAVCVERNEP